MGELGDARPSPGGGPKRRCHAAGLDPISCAPSFSRASARGILGRMRSTRFVLSVSFVASLLLSGCDGGVSPADAGPDAPLPGDAGSGEPTGLLRLDCEPLAPSTCALPFPSSWFLRDDPTTVTGYRVALGETTLPETLTRGRSIRPESFNTRDGFSVSAAPLVLLPGATATGLARSNSIERSLEASSPTVILDAETGQRVAHFVDLDAATGNDQSRALLLRQALPFEHDRRYIVALRDVVDASGAPLQPSEVFRALRDGAEHAHPYVSRRRADFEDLFSRLEAAGVERSTLQIAWDFHTASLEDDTRHLTHMRDDALAIVGAQGPSYRITELQEDVDPHTRLRIDGMMEVPLYLAQAEAGPASRLRLDDMGRPMRMGTAEYPFVVVVPRSASPESPATAVHIGHGLLGSRLEATSEFLRRWANANNRILIATDWIGMASEDTPSILTMLSQGRLEDFGMLPDRLCQGVVNALLLMRMVRGRFADDPAMQVDGASIVDRSAGYYYGGSQGGIFGGTYMAVTTDVERGILAVPGQSYHLMLDRSVNFDQFGSVMRTSIEDGADIPLVLALVQQLWDRADPGSFSRHIGSGRLANGQRHEALLLVSIGDHQVTTLSAHVMARAMGAPNLAPVNRSLFGIEDRTGPIAGSAMIEFDFGLGPEPVDNLPMREGRDPHNRIAEIPVAYVMAEQWFRTGVLEQLCEGPCDLGDVP